MKILLIGGTGAMGKNLVSLLSKGDNEIHVTSRSFHKNEKNIVYFKGNGLDNDFVFSLLENKYDAIVDFMLYDEMTLFNSRMDCFLENTKHYIFISTCRVYSNDNKKITEKSKRILDEINKYEYISSSSNEYSILKAKQEDVLLSKKKKNFTIVRPYITYDTQRLQLGIYEKEEWLYRIFNGKTMVISQDILTRLTSLTYGADVALRINELIIKNNPSGEIFQIVNDASMTWEDVLMVYKDVIEKKLNKEMKIKLVKSIYEVKILFPNIQYEYDRSYDRVFDSSKINKVCKGKKYTPITQGLEKCLDEFLDNPSFGSIDWLEQAIMDKICKEKTSIKDIVGVKNKIKYVMCRYLGFTFLFKSVGLFKRKKKCGY